ncbi:aspartate aminotransferase family protein [Deltaproteobacteria bacterium TL4]
MNYATNPKISQITEDLISKGGHHYIPVYAPKAMVLSHGQGARLWDLDGKNYIDLGAGIGVNGLGHQHPKLLEAMQAQAQKLWHTSNLYYTEPSIRLAEELVQSSFADRVFFTNSGTEAIEFAIKLARKYSSTQFPEDKREIITFTGSFHGRTLAAVTATAQPKYQEGFEPLPGGFHYCPFNDFEAIEKIISEKTCAVFVEPIQGEGGIHKAKPGFLKHLRALCDQHQALLVFDEIQCGMGRTGKLFAHQWDAVTPDLMTLAKALGCGLPIGALLSTEKVAQILKVGQHGSTFGGNPVVTAVGRVALRELKSPELEEQVLKQGAALCKRLEAINADLNLFSEIRGHGLMIGAELQGPWAGKSKELNDFCLEQGVLILQAGANVLRFLPPLNITVIELNEGMDRVEKALRLFQHAS